MVGEETEVPRGKSFSSQEGCGDSSPRQGTANRVTQGLDVPAQSQQPPRANGSNFLGPKLLPSLRTPLRPVRAPLARVAARVARTLLLLTSCQICSPLSFVLRRVCLSSGCSLFIVAVSPEEHTRTHAPTTFATRELFRLLLDFHNGGQHCHEHLHVDNLFLLLLNALLKVKSKVGSCSVTLPLGVWG